MWILLSNQGHCRRSDGLENKLPWQQRLHQFAIKWCWPVWSFTTGNSIEFTGNRCHNIQRHYNFIVEQKNLNNIELLVQSRHAVRNDRSVWRHTQSVLRLEKKNSEWNGSDVREQTWRLCGGGAQLETNHLLCSSVIHSIGSLFWSQYELLIHL